MAKPAKGGVFGAALGLEESPAPADDADYEDDDGAESENEALTACAADVRASMDDPEAFRDALARFVRLVK